MTEQDPEKQETLLAQASAQLKEKKRKKLETALTIFVPLLFVGLICIFFYSIMMHQGEDTRNDI